MQITCIDSQKMRPVEFIGLNFVIVNHTGLLALLQEFVAGTSQRTAIYPLWWGSWRRTLCPPLQVPGILDTGLINTYTNLKLSFDGEPSFWSNLKGQCHKIFTPHFFSWIDYTWAPYEQAKTVLQNISISQRYSRKQRVRVLR